ncbi:hypothetical protein COCON_G00165780 [Conger conger]|uniref:Uncharacterized protein n=1 Tax=Conger conger TaxID=82655 RepID=A0A9Q1HTN4_CONCO|nr:hypothetical protein COCON_G00165780 [Conger conger]
MKRDDQTPACKLQLARRQRHRGSRTLRLTTGDHEEEEENEDEPEPEAQSGTSARTASLPNSDPAWDASPAANRLPPAEQQQAGLLCVPFIDASQTGTITAIRHVYIYIYMWLHASNVSSWSERKCF